ncbi:hypothetical protein TELCIR_00186 [Teladorsagia circumcincta]|uniref:Uncharacterized protein n=1 Tax=Teladorsagia circumcincta TaxID=45464 RepID=A0A2G9V5D9_TELCI|nr:hypothetical protein TELCIR_00186 [Teladorsagia circumcincta]
MMNIVKRCACHAPSLTADYRGNPIDFDDHIVVEDFRGFGSDAISFALFMTPGVRPFVQHYNSTTWLTMLALIVSVLCLRHAHHSTQLLGPAFMVFTIVAALAFGVLTAKFDTEVVYTVSTMNGGVFLAHVVYCVQSFRSLRFATSLMITTVNRAGPHQGKPRGTFPPKEKP